MIRREYRIPAPSQAEGCGGCGEREKSAEEGDHPMASLFPVLVTSLFLILGTLTGSTSAREG